MRPLPQKPYPVEVTQEQIEFFRTHGYLVYGRVTTDEELEWLAEIYDYLFNNRVGEREGLYFDLGGPRAHDGAEVLPQVLGPERTFPQLRETNYFRNARKIAAQLLGVPLDLVHGGGHMILKPARYGRETPWHQDEAYWNPAAIHHGLSAWMSLDPAPIESGCLHFIPGSHVDEEVFPHRHIDDNPLVHGLVTDHVDPSAAVPCPVGPGEATFHHCRTLHYAGPNRTDTPRRAYILVFNGPAKKRVQPAHRPWLEEEAQALKRLKSLARESS